MPLRRSREAGTAARKLASELVVPAAATTKRVGKVQEMIQAARRLER
jgi:hypothetical protein